MFFKTNKSLVQYDMSMTLDTLESIEKFLEGNQRVALSVQGTKYERYQFIPG